VWGDWGRDLIGGEAFHLDAPGPGWEDGVRQLLQRDVLQEGRFECIYLTKLNICRVFMSRGRWSVTTLVTRTYFDHAVCSKRGNKMGSIRLDAPGPR
jgi:hypothetical protein